MAQRSCLAVDTPTESFAGALAPGEQPDEQWMAARLHPLSYLLARPQPTRGGFVFPADDHFYDDCTRRHLHDAFNAVLAHLGLPRAAVGHVAFDPNLNFGGRVTHGRNESYIQLSPEHAESPHEIGALVAHECAHVLAHRRRLPVMGGWEDEVNTDLIVVLCGLGPLLAGSETAVNYLAPERAAYAHTYVSRSLGLEPADRMPPPPLRFGPPADTTWVRCPHCAKGMRIRGAAGRQAQVTCNGCANVLAFDGRLCRVERAGEPDDQS